jgi:cytoskeletal protein CcmA (bactofilin family)
MTLALGSNGVVAIATGNSGSATVGDPTILGNNPYKFGVAGSFGVKGASTLTGNTEVIGNVVVTGNTTILGTLTANNFAINGTLSSLTVTDYILVSGTGNHALQFTKQDGSTDNAVFYDRSVASNDVYFGRDSDNLFFRTGGTTKVTLNSSGTLAVTGAVTSTNITCTYGGAPNLPAAFATHSGTGFKFSHGNTAYYGTLGTLNGGGAPFIGLHAEHSTTANTLKNSGAGVRGMYMQWNGSNFVTVINGTATADADFSSEITATSIDISGNYTIYGSTIVGNSKGSLPGVTCALRVAFAGAGTEYGLAFRPVSDSTNAVYFTNAAGTGIGSITTSSTATAFNTTSDARLKEDLVPISDPDKIIDALDVWDFKWKDKETRSKGVIAQDAHKVMPDAVTEPKNDEEFWQVDYSKFVPVLIADNQNMRKEIQALKEHLQRLEEFIASAIHK